MHRIDGAGHVGNMFVTEDPAVNRPPTEVTAEILNAFQEELAGLIEWSGLALNKADNTQVKQTLLAKYALKHTYKDGLLLSNNVANPTTQIDISAGRASDSTNSVDLILAAGLTKTIQLAGAWAAGTGQNGLFSGARASNAWYHVFLIQKTADGTIDAGLDTSITAAHIPAGYAAYRWLFAIKTDGSGNIIPFLQIGNYCEWKTTISELNSIGISSAPALLIVSVPPGMKAKADLIYRIVSFASGSEYVRLSDPDCSDEAATATNSQISATSFSSAGGETRTGALTCYTDTSGRVRYRGNTNDATVYLNLASSGWYIPTL